ncbi:MAG: hypothetical protein ABI056_03485 [Caulobacteraceae bacterium]
MATLTIRNLPQSTHDLLRRRAAENRRSMEAEARTILESTVLPAQALDMEKIRRLQERTIAAFGGPGAARGEVERFLSERRGEWGE